MGDGSYNGSFERFERFIGSLECNYLSSKKAVSGAVDKLNLREGTMGVVVDDSDADAFFSTYCTLAGHVALVRAIPELLKDPEAKRFYDLTVANLECMTDGIKSFVVGMPNRLSNHALEGEVSSP
ncbi:hypothetical protein COU61_05125 [Candidatus Pacearchaeota archaeon CG10_big_fil_rev_8_21_14_0_10_35_13]|nr:MAG: hypothetical protein COU61_05125 [Candidatus Pacearchaeota archaeon CG10_big_fil_rev_8_21_14_0_10_35_13]